MRSKFAFKNVFYAIILQVIVSLFGFITPNLLIRNYGSEINGLVSSIKQVLRYFNLLEVGLSGAAVYELYKYLRNKDFYNINKIVTYSSRYYRRIGILMIVGTLILGPFFSSYIFESSLSFNTVNSIFLVLGFSGALEFIFMSRCRIIFTADQKSYIISIALIISTIVTQTLTILLIVNQVPIVLIYLISTLINLVRGIFLNLVVKNAYDGNISFSSESKGFKLDKQKYVFYHEIFHTVNNTIPLIVINIHYDLNVASIYAVYNMVIVTINSILSTIYQSITASYGNLVTENNIVKENEVFNSFQFIYLGFSSWLISTTAFLITPFVSLYTKNISTIDYGIHSLGGFLILFCVANSIRVVFSMPNSAHGFYKETYKFANQITIVGALISLILGKISPALTLAGPIFSFVINSMYQMNFLRKSVIGLETRTAIKSIVNLISCVVISLIISYNLDIEFQNINDFIWVGLISSIIIGIVVVILFFFSERKKLHLHIKYIRQIVGR